MYSDFFRSFRTRPSPARVGKPEETALARRSRESIQRRLREQRRIEKAALKRQRRAERRQGAQTGPDDDAPEGGETPEDGQNEESPSKTSTDAD